MSLHAATPSRIVQRPILIYTDIASGPSDGGENNKGIYLSVFGKNFGQGKLGSTIKVFIGDAEVDNYRSLKPARGRPDIEQITVQIGMLGGQKAGKALPIKVVVDGIEAVGDVSFIINPGRILFVDNVRGNDLNAVVGDVDRPFRHVQTGRLTEGAWGVVQPGDFIVMRGTGTNWTDPGFENYFLRIQNKSGTAPTGVAGSGPISVMGYPGEMVMIYRPFVAETTDKRDRAPGGISAVNGLNLPGIGQWISISNLRIEAGGSDGPINVQILGNHWRIVNNELSAATAVKNSNAKSAGIAGNGFGEVWLGNHIHDVYCGPEPGGPLQNHGIYIDGDGDFEIAYNLIENIAGGSGFQTYVNGTNGSETTGNVNFHHNLIRSVGKHGINLADGTKEGIKIFNNIIVNTRYAGLRLNSTQLHRAKIYNNTFSNTNIEGKSRYGAIMNDWQLGPDAVDIQNNIFVPHPGTDYAGGTVGFAGNIGIINRNFWHGGKGDIGFDRYPQSGELKFRVADKDFHLLPESWAIDAGSAAVARIVNNDFDITTRRPQGLGFDIGAFEATR
jgi:hypothetical protein